MYSKVIPFSNLFNFNTAQYNTADTIFLKDVVALNEVTIKNHKPYEIGSTGKIRNYSTSFKTEKIIMIDVSSYNNSSIDYIKIFLFQVNPSTVMVVDLN